MKILIHTSSISFFYALKCELDYQKIQDISIYASWTKLAYDISTKKLDCNCEYQIYIYSSTSEDLLALGFLQEQMPQSNINFLVSTLKRDLDANGFLALAQKTIYDIYAAEKLTIHEKIA